MALPKANRLKRQQDFNAVYQKGIRRRARYLTLRALRQGHSGNDRSSDDEAAAFRVLPCQTCIGISISQKVSKRAVIRNRIKRQIRAAFRQLLPRLSRGWNVVVVVHPQAVECDYFQFLQELEQLLIDAEVLNGHS